LIKISDVDKHGVNDDASVDAKHDYNKNNHKEINNLNMDEESHTGNNDLDEGTLFFMKWLGSDNKKSLDNPFTVIEFVHSNRSLLRDRLSHADVLVQSTQGIPHCNHCKTDDCAHVGFTICLEQLYFRGESLNDINDEN
jgi:hypothetical protein